MSIIVFLFLGILIGFVMSIPLGPMGVVIIQRTLRFGRYPGLFSGMGIATADTLYATLALCGLSLVINVIQANALFMKLLGGIILLIMGISIFVRDPACVSLHGDESTNGKKRWMEHFISLFFLTLSNPMILLAYMAAFASFSNLNVETPLIARIVVLAGVWIGCSSWWMLITLVINHFRQKFKLRSLLLINRFAGLAIGVFGIALIIMAFLPLLRVFLSNSMVP